MLRAIVFFFLFVGSPAFSRDITWFRGSVVLNDQRVLVGDISINSSELILFRNSDSISVFPAHKIQLVRYYDKVENVNRKFVAMNDPESLFQHFSLYEVVVMGKLDIVRKQHRIMKEFASDIFDFDYFILSGNSRIPLQQFKQKMLGQLLAESDSLQSFIEEEKLDPRNQGDAIRIIVFYNRSIHRGHCPS